MTNPDPAHGAGQALDTELAERLAGLTLEQKVRLVTGETFWTLYAEPAIGLRSLVVSDGPAGVRGTEWDERSWSLNVPSPTALAASWDAELVHEVGRLLAAECRRKGVDVLLAPTVNLHRSPVGGRHFECFSEDPLLTGVIGSAFVAGLQEEGVGACVKHFVANDSETERFTLDARVDERTLRELYLAPFEQIAGRAGAWSVMASYNAVNGTTMTESPMINEILKGEWGWDGLIMSDWFAARSTEPAGREGLDLAMPGPTGPWGQALVDAVRAGAVPEQAVDAKVTRLLRLAARVGALEGIAPARSTATVWAQPDAERLLTRAAAAGTVLARNDDLLPLAADRLRRVAVVGPNAARLRTLGGGSATVFPPHVVDLPQGLAEVLGEGAEVLLAQGVRTHTRLPMVPAEQLGLPDGGQGAVVRFLAADGRELAREERFAASWNWHGTLAGLAPAEVEWVEVRTRLTPAVDGPHQVGASGIGRFSCDVDGATIFDATISLAPGLDPVEALSRPPQHSATVPLTAGRPVEVVLRHQLRSGATGSAFGEGMGVTFQLNLQEPYPGDDAAIAEAVELAAGCDVAVVVVGTTEEVESEGYDRDTLALPGRQDDLVRAVAAANPSTVVVVNAGAPVLLPWVHQVPAVLLGWFPGQEGGRALAQVLVGAQEPGGRLPVTWPAAQDEAAALPGTRPQDGVLTYAEGLQVGYRSPQRRQGAAFEFGHGLGYTTWHYAGPEVEEQDQGWVVQVPVTNTGDRAGREVVQVYAGRPDSPLPVPQAWLVGCAVVEAGPGESVTARVPVTRRALSSWDAEAHGWVLPAGSVTFSAGRSLADLRGEVTVAVR